MGTLQHHTCLYLTAGLPPVLSRHSISQHMLLAFFLRLTEHGVVRPLTKHLKNQASVCNPEKPQGMLPPCFKRFTDLYRKPAGPMRELPYSVTHSLSHQTCLQTCFLARDVQASSINCKWKICLLSPVLEQQIRCVLSGPCWTQLKSLDPDAL